MSTKTPIQSDDVPSDPTGNDRLIRDALATLSDPAKRKKMKLKPTVASLQKLTKLSLNTIRGRAWALKAVRDLKAEAKKPSQAEVLKVEQGEEPIIDPEVAVSRQLEGLLKQNSLFYEEILYLRREVKRRDEILENLQGGRLSAI